MRRDKHLTWARFGGDARPDVDRDASDLAVDELALPRVEAGANVDSEVAHRLSDLARAADPSRGTVEAREEAVARGVELASAEARKVPADDRVVVANSSPQAWSPSSASFSVEPTMS